MQRIALAAVLFLAFGLFVTVVYVANDGNQVKTYGINRAAPPEAWRPIPEARCEELQREATFYVNPHSQVIAAHERLDEEGRRVERNLLREISCYPQAVWILQRDPAAAAQIAAAHAAQAAKRGQTPVFVLYSNPHPREARWQNGNDAEAYLDWIAAIAEALAQTNAWIVLEPDALAFAASYAPEERRARLSQLHAAVAMLAQRTPQARVYLDAGHSGWIAREEMSTLLREAGVGRARGFSLNVSNYRRTENEAAYGRALVEALGGGHFLIDTSRNGNGPAPDADWCNVLGRALGEHPSRDAGDPLIDALLWIKPPGESDGACRGGPPAGEFWVDYALMLVTNKLTARQQR